MSWINETREASINHYRGSHQRESIKTKLENTLKILSGYSVHILSGYIFFAFVVIAFWGYTYVHVCGSDYQNGRKMFF